MFTATLPANEEDNEWAVAALAARRVPALHVRCQAAARDGRDKGRLETPGEPGGRLVAIELLQVSQPTPAVYRKPYITQTQTKPEAAIELPESLKD